MSDKTAPIGTCDHCGGPIPPDEWYTRRGPRRYCCIDCKNTANSRNSKPIRTAKAVQRVEDGTWYNPRSQMTPEEISAIQSRASKTSRKREVAEGRWRNPGLDAAARAENSRRQRERFSDPAVREAHRQYTLAKVLSDARSNRSRFAIHIDLWPPGCNAAYCRMDGPRVIIEPVQYQFAPRDTSMPRAGSQLPYTAARLGDRRIAIEARAWLRAEPMPWRCVERGERLVFEPDI